MSTNTASTSAISHSPVDAAPAADAPGPRKAAWAGVVSLGLGIFTLVASEFLPASLLSPIAADLGVTEGVAGQLVTATSIIGIVGGPLVVSALPRVDRRTVMVGLTTLAVISNVLVAIAPVFGLMLASRLLLGLAISGFWAMSLAVTSQLVPADRLGRAMTIVNTGLSLATIAAVPAGAVLGDLLGWRTVFLGAAAVGVIALTVQMATLPSVPPTGAPGFGTLVRTAARPVVALGILSVVLIAGGHFAGFTYLRPAFESIGEVTPSTLALLLAVFGLASFAGNLAAGPLADRRLGVLLVAAPTAIGASMVLYALWGANPVVAVAVVSVWGAGFGAVPTMIQTWMARVAPDRLESAGGLIVAAFQTAITIGAAVGGLLVDSVGVQVAFLGGGISAMLGGMVLATARRR
ncbi:MFS transporter [Agromyces cerinus]|uniref:MFS transporter, DHA1 family, purine ribonucleoside efflux pump n=1 Tax=Agromyces cerinus subsp. cerinus TaxID=232089 RepID=A0A1N6GFX7_9MICO|nr:MFS transporter [Agromyces cerinus]SIO06455.1 MFS transporter, DHA1 family, purine ribonucleoside efflux pump [Agromyces cerinus subsp. cerinus]